MDSMDPRDAEIKRLQAEIERHKLIIEQHQEEIERLRSFKAKKNNELETRTDTDTSDDDWCDDEPSGTPEDEKDTPAWPAKWFQKPLPVFTCGEVHPDWSVGPDRIRGNALYESVALLVEDDADRLRGSTASIIEKKGGVCDLSGLMPSFQTATDLATEIRGGYSIGASAEVAALMTVVKQRIVVVLRSGEIANSAFISDFGAEFSHSKPIFLLCDAFSGQYYPMSVYGTAVADQSFELKQDATRERLGYCTLEDLTCSRHKILGCWSCFCRTEMTRELAIDHNRDDDGVIFTNSKGQRMCSPHWRQYCADCYLDFRAVNHTSV